MMVVVVDWWWPQEVGEQGRSPNLVGFWSPSPGRGQWTLSSADWWIGSTGLDPTSQLIRSSSDSGSISSGGSNKHQRSTVTGEGSLAVGAVCPCSLFSLSLSLAHPLLFVCLSALAWPGLR